MTIDDVPVCDNCGANDFTLEDGFYFCRDCGAQARDRREVETENIGATTGFAVIRAKRSKKSVREEKEQRANGRKFQLDPFICERALPTEDYPRWLDRVGSRLCTATKLVSKIAFALTEEEFRVPEKCIECAQFVLISYFRQHGVAFCEKECTTAANEKFCPLVKLTQKEIAKIKAEKKKEAKELRKQRRQQLIEEATVWERIAEDFEKKLEQRLRAEELKTEAVSLFEKINTSLSVNALNLACVLYLDIDMLLCIVYVAVQMCGAQWIQLSDLFRWYREGRFCISHSQLCSLGMATSWQQDEEGQATGKSAQCTERRFHSRNVFGAPYLGIQSSSESFRVLSFLVQSLNKPKSFPTIDLQKILPLFVYNLNLPKAFLHHLRLLCSILPPISTDYGAQRLGKKTPLNKRFFEILMEIANGSHYEKRYFGNTAFFRLAFLKQTSNLCAKNLRKSCWHWLPIPTEVNAAALVLFALKLFFGLDETKEYELRPKPAADGQLGEKEQPFNFAHWFVQLQLRTHVWQGTAPTVVLGKGFALSQMERLTPDDVPYRRGTVNTTGRAKHLNYIRKAAFAGCVPNRVLNRAQPYLFERLFPAQTVSTAKILAGTHSNEELFAPLQHQAIAHQSLLKDATSSLDEDNLEIFFRRFCDSHLDLECPSVPAASSENQEGLPELNKFTKLFPCAQKYQRIPLQIVSVELRRLIVRPLLYETGHRLIFASAEHLFSDKFRLLIRHLSLVVSEKEQLLYTAFMAIEGMFFDGLGRSGKEPEYDDEDIEIMDELESDDSHDEDDDEGGGDLHRSVALNE